MSLDQILETRQFDYSKNLVLQKTGKQVFTCFENLTIIGGLGLDK